MRGSPVYRYPDEVHVRVPTLFGIVSLYLYSEVLYAETRLEDFDEIRQIIRRRTIELFDELRKQSLFLFVTDPIRVYRRHHILAEIDASFPVQLELRGNVTDALYAMHGETQRLLLTKCFNRFLELGDDESELTRLVSEFLRTHASPVRFNGYEFSVSGDLMEVISKYPKLILQVRYPQTTRPKLMDLSIWEFANWNTLHSRILLGGSPPTLPYSSKSRRGLGDIKFKLQVLVEVDGTIVVGCKLGEISGSLLVTPRDKDYLKNLVDQKRMVRRRSPERLSYIDWDSVVKLCDSVISIV